MRNKRSIEWMSRNRIDNSRSWDRRGWKEINQTTQQPTSFLLWWWAVCVVGYGPMMGSQQQGRAAVNNHRATAAHDPHPRDDHRILQNYNHGAKKKKESKNNNNWTVKHGRWPFGSASPSFSFCSGWLDAWDRNALRPYSLLLFIVTKSWCCSILRSTHHLSPLTTNHTTHLLIIHLQILLVIQLYQSKKGKTKTISCQHPCFSHSWRPFATRLSRIQRNSDGRWMEKDKVIHYKWFNSLSAELQCTMSIPPVFLFYLEHSAQNIDITAANKVLLCFVLHRWDCRLQLFGWPWSWRHPTATGAT